MGNIKEFPWTNHKNAEVFGNELLFQYSETVKAQVEHETMAIFGCLRGFAAHLKLENKFNQEQIFPIFKENKGFDERLMLSTLAFKLKGGFMRIDNVKADDKDLTR